MPLIDTLRLIHVATQKGRDADLYSPIEDKHFGEYESKWRSFIEEKLKEQLRPPINELPSEELDRLHLRGLHWQWRRKAEHCSERECRSFALVCDGETQGLMLAKLGVSCRLEENSGQKLVYIDLVATAPWNRPAFVDVPRYRGVGSMMIKAAIELSDEQGYNGRIGLHSLESATWFYERCGMETTGRDPEYENLPYYEMTAESATKFLEKLA